MIKSISKQIKKRKINVDIKRPMDVFVRYYPIFVIFGIIAGFLYQWILLSCFSIEVTNYFALNDYLHLAIIPLAIVTMLAALFLVGSHVISFTHLPSLQELKKNWCNKRSIISTAAVALLFIVLGIYLEDKTYTILGMASLAIVIPIGLFLKKNVKNGFQIFSLFLVFFVFVIGIIGLSIIKVDNIQNLHDTRDFIEIYLTQRSNLKITNPIKLIALNSQYCFLYDVHKGKIIIVPVKNIDYIVEARAKAIG